MQYLDTDGGASQPSDVEIADALADFSSYIVTIVTRKNKKVDYDDAFLLGHILRDESTVDGNAEARAFCRCQLIVAVREFRLLVDEISVLGSGTITFANVLLYHDNLIDYLFDIKNYAEFLQREAVPGFILFEGGKRYHSLVFELFSFSRQLSHYAATPALEKVPLSNRECQITAIFVLRQALELKFRRIINVEIFDKQGRTPKIRHDFHYNFIRQNEAQFAFVNADLPNIKKIYDWCNEIVHNAYQPLVWHVSYAHRICHGLLAPQSVTAGGGWSVFNAVEIANTNTMQDAYIEYFRSNYDHGKWHFETLKPEAIAKHWTNRQGDIS